MYPDWVGLLAWGFLVIWLGILSFLVWQQSKFLKSLFPKSESRDIRKKFEETLEIVEDFGNRLTDLNSKVALIQSQGLEYTQRVELLRFNPFNDTGGDQSFAVCFLNSEGSGIVVTSLHARSGTRLFGKEIVLGKSAKYELSKEEEQVIKKAMAKEL